LTTEILITVEHENEVSAEAVQMAADLGAQQVANSIEESGGGQSSARGVIQSGRPQE
jgi:hypothetical protein